MIAVIGRGEFRAGCVSIPASKSLSHRALLAASLAEGTSRIRCLGDSRDITATMSALEHFGVRFAQSGSVTEVTGVPRPVYDGGVVDCGESGSTLRFLIPIAAMQDREVVFTGHGRLMDRPQTVYEEIFGSRGLLFERRGAFLHVGGPLTDGCYTVDGNVSSQFITGLLYALPLAGAESTVTIRPPFESESYVRLTMDVLEKAGIEVRRDGMTFRVRGSYRPCELKVTGDDSQMAFFAAAALLRGTPVEVRNADHDSRQGDHVILDHIRAFGGGVQETEDGYRFLPGHLHAARIDLGDCPDLGPMLFALAAMAEGETVFTHCARLRIKESDRIACMEEELRKLGCRIRSSEDTVYVTGTDAPAGGVHLDGHNDHRIVMALSVLSSIAAEPVTIHGAEAVAKSYPGFFKDLAAAGVKVEYAEG